MVAFTPGFITCNATYNVGNISDVAGIDDTMIEKSPRICHFSSLHSSQHISIIFEMSRESIVLVSVEIMMVLISQLIERSTEKFVAFSIV